MSYQTKVRANKMNRTAKLAFYKARQRQGDTTRLAEETGYTTRFVNYVKSGECRGCYIESNGFINIVSQR